MLQLENGGVLYHMSFNNPAVVCCTASKHVSHVLENLCSCIFLNLANSHPRSKRSFKRNHDCHHYNSKTWMPDCQDLQFDPQQLCSANRLIMSTVPTIRQFTLPSPPTLPVTVLFQMSKTYSCRHWCSMRKCK